MKLEASMLLQELERTFSELLPMLEHLKKFTEENSMDKKECADIAFATREADKHLNDFKHRVNELHRKASATCSIAMAMTGEDIVRTDHCSATSNPKPWYRIPYKRDKGPEQWDEIMEGVGIPPSSVGNQRGIVRLHAPELMVYCGELIGEGGKPPAGIDPKRMTGMELNLRITKKR